MSIVINSLSANTVVLTLTEKTNVVSPTYLFSFENQTTKDQKNFIAADTSTYPERYNQFTITEVAAGSENLLTGSVSLKPEGFWNYTIYAQSSTTNLIPASATEVVERGIVRVIGSDVQTYNAYSGQSTDINYYNPEE